MDETSRTGQVQPCGCIALPEDVQQQSGLYPGATYTMEITEDGAAILLRTLEPSQPGEPNLGISCG
jgi:hypothetical protein